MFKNSCVQNNYFPIKKLLKTIIILLAKDFPMSISGSEGYANSAVHSRRAATEEVTT